jgi:hypothetical protein
MSMQDDILAAMRIAEPVYSASTTEWRLSNSRFHGPQHQIIQPENHMVSDFHSPSQSVLLCKWVHLLTFFLTNRRSSMIFDGIIVRASS